MNTACPYLPRPRSTRHDTWPRLAALFALVLTCLLTGCRNGGSSGTESDEISPGSTTPEASAPDTPTEADAFAVVQSFQLVRVRSLSSVEKLDGVRSEADGVPRYRMQVRVN